MFQYQRTKKEANSGLLFWMWTWNYLGYQGPGYLWASNEGAVNKSNTATKKNLRTEFSITMRTQKITTVMINLGFVVLRRLLMKMMKMMKFCTHAQVCANEQIISATSPHTAPVRGSCHSHGAATSMGLGGNLRLWRRGRWWWWNWNTHTYGQCSGRGKKA